MDLNTLYDTPPWEWPEGTDKLFLEILRNEQADGSDRLLAAEMAGDFTVINDDLADVLLGVVKNSDESEDMRGRAVISLGPALEYSYMEEFEDPDDLAISEGMFNKIQESLQRLHRDAGIPNDVRRRILEASVRAPQDWHQAAVRAAYAGNDTDWTLTAVFCMQYIRGFENQILEALESGNPDIRYEAICAAGAWAVDEAWPHIKAILFSGESDKDLLLAAIEASANIRPQEAAEALLRLIQSEDDDIVDAVYEAMAMADVPWDDDFDEEDFDENDDLLH